MKAQTINAEASAAVFAALGDSSRLTLVTLLCRDGPLPTIRLKQATRFSRQAVTKHLQLLETSGIVTSQRVGRDRLWSVEPGKLV
jgi:predicted transcriptional regulator